MDHGSSSSHGQRTRMDGAHPDRYGHTMSTLTGALDIHIGPPSVDARSSSGPLVAGPSSITDPGGALDLLKPSGTPAYPTPQPNASWDPTASTSAHSPTSGSQSAWARAQSPTSPTKLDDVTLSDSGWCMSLPPSALGSSAAQSPSLDMGLQLERGVLPSSEHDYPALQSFADSLFGTAFQSAGTQPVSRGGSPALVDTASFLPPGWSRSLDEHAPRSVHQFSQIGDVSEMDWDAVMSMTSAGHDRPLSTSPHSPTSLAPPLSPRRALYAHTTPLNRLQRLPEDSSADFSPSDNGSTSTSPPSQRMSLQSGMQNRHRRSLPLDYSRQSGSGLSAPGGPPSTTSPSPLRRPSGPRASSGMTVPSIRGRNVRAAGDRSGVRHLYATSHGRAYSDHAGHNVDGGMQTRRRAGTTAGSQGGAAAQESGHLRTTTSMPLIEDPSSSAAPSFSHGQPSMPPEMFYTSDSASREPTSAIRNTVREQEGLTASITDDFESLGLDLELLPGVGDVTMGDGFGPANSTMRRTSTQHNTYATRLGIQDGSLSPFTSTGREELSQGDGFLHPSTTGHRYPSYMRVTQTPLSPPESSAHAQPLLSRGHISASSPRPPVGYHSHPADSARRGEATEFGVGMDTGTSRSAINSWPRARVQQERSSASTASHADVRQRSHAPLMDGSGSSRPCIASRSSPQIPASAGLAAPGFVDERTSVHTSKSAEPLVRSERLQLASLPSPTMVPGQSVSSSSKKASRPMSMDGLSSSTRPGRMTDPVSGGLVSPGNRSRKVDYTQVSAALETLRAFLRQKESANLDRAGTSPSEVDVAGPVQRQYSSEVGTSSSASRTLRHTSGHLPPRGSVRIGDAEAGRAGTQSSSDPRRGGADTRDQRRRQRSSVGSSGALDGPFRENDRMEALRHLADRVRALRQSSQHHSDDNDDHSRDSSGVQ